MKIDLLATKPYDIEIPGDNMDLIMMQDDTELRPRIMFRNGELMGISKDLAVWRFGFPEGSESANAYGVCLERGSDGNMAFVWVLATRKSGLIRGVVRDWAVNLPQHFKNVIEAPVIVEDPGGYMSRPNVHSARSHKVVVG